MIGFALLENSITVLQTRVAALPPDSVPPEIRAQIDRLALVWTFKLVHLEARLVASVEALAAAGIEVTLLKGAALALTTYSRFADRPMADLDLMVDSARAAEAHAILQCSGWRIETGSFAADSWDDHHHLPPLADTTGSGLRLELHTDPLAPGHRFRLSGAYVLHSARRAQIGSAHALVPEQHLHAVHAAIHFAYSHQFASGGLNFCRDIAKLSARPDWSWDRFTALAIHTSSQTACYWALRLATALSGLSVPSSVVDAVSPHLGERISCILEKHFSQIVLRSEHSCPSAELRHRLWAFALQVPESAGRRGEEWQPARNDARAPLDSTLRRVGTHLRRAPRWSRYVASLIVPALERIA